MKVRELIEFLQTMPQDIDVAFCCYSEQMLMEVGDIDLMNGCPPRPDGWIQNERPDEEKQQYLLFPGN